MYEPKSVCSGARLKATCQVPGELCGHATYYCFEKTSYYFPQQQLNQPYLQFSCIYNLYHHFNKLLKVY